MIAFDADVLTELLAGRPDYIQRATSMSSETQAVPVIVIEEIVRGRLNMIRQAESSNAKIGLDRAYQLFQETIADFSRFPVLAYDPQADLLFQNWPACDQDVSDNRQAGSLPHSTSWKLAPQHKPEVCPTAQAGSMPRVVGWRCTPRGVCF